MKKIGLAMVATLCVCLVGTIGCGGSGQNEVIEVSTDVADETADVGVGEEEYDAAMEADMAEQGP